MLFYDILMPAMGKLIEFEKRKERVNSFRVRDDTEIVTIVLYPTTGTTVVYDRRSKAYPQPLIGRNSASKKEAA